MMSVDVFLATALYEPDPNRTVAILALLTLAETEGYASPAELARNALVRRDPRLDTLRARLPGVLSALVRAGVVARRGRRYTLPPAASTPEIRRRLISLCEQRLSELVPDPMWAQALDTSDGRCADCGAQVDPSELHVNLIIPRSRGGTLTIANLEALCPACSAQRYLSGLVERAPSSALSSDPTCPFCDPTRMPPPVAVNGTAFAIRDLHPVSAGHTLVIPRRHTANFFTMTSVERRDADDLLRYLKSTLEREDPTIHGFNLGINCGEIPGQTVFHAHTHLIPRRSGDTPRPRGGVRGVIPERMGY